MNARTSGTFRLKLLGARWNAAHRAYAGAGLADMPRNSARSTRVWTVGALLMAVVYAMIATALVPGLWFDPLGALTRIAPIMVLHPIALAVLVHR